MKGGHRQRRGRHKGTCKREGVVLAAEESGCKAGPAEPAARRTRCAVLPEIVSESPITPYRQAVYGQRQSSPYIMVIHHD